MGEAELMGAYYVNNILFYVNCSDKVVDTDKI